MLSWPHATNAVCMVGDPHGDMETFAADVKADIAVLDGLQRIHYTGALDEALLGL